MDYFALFLDSLCLIVGHGVMHMAFISRLTGKKQKLWYFVAYLLLLGAVQFVSIRLSLSGTLSIVVGVFALYAISRFGMGNPQSVSWLAAVLSFYISQLSFGIINSVEAALFPHFIGSSLLYLLLLAAQILFLVLCAGCYHAVLRLLTWTEDSQTPYIGLLLFPGLFFFAAELYILQTAYSFFAPVVSLEEVGRHSTLLLLQVMGLAALLCTLYAYRQLCKGFQAQAELQSLTQAARAEDLYHRGSGALRADKILPPRYQKSSVRIGRFTQKRKSGGGAGVPEQAGDRLRGPILPVPDRQPGGGYSIGGEAGAGEGNRGGGVPGLAQALRDRRF